MTPKAKITMSRPRTPSIVSLELEIIPTTINPTTMTPLPRANIQYSYRCDRPLKRAYFFNTLKYQDIFMVSG